jgi:hypothetical protein
MDGTGKILAALWEVSLELADTPTVFGVSCCSRDTSEDSQTVDEPCCLEVPAFWKKSIPQFSSNFQIRRGAHKHFFSGDHPTTQTHTKLDAVKLC